MEMFDLCSVCTTAFYLFILYIIVQIIRLALTDCDLALQWASRLGRGIGHLRGKVVWITGASSGIGECLSYELAAAGCKLILSARRKDQLEKVKKQCLMVGPLKDSDILVLPLDALKFDTHKAAVNTALRHFSGIDILVNNAGRSQRASWEDTELQVDIDMLNLNVLGVLSLTKAVLPHMIETHGGHVVIMSSVAGKIDPTKTQPTTPSTGIDSDAVPGTSFAADVPMVSTESEIPSTSVCEHPTSPSATDTDTDEADSDGSDIYNESSNSDQGAPMSGSYCGSKHALQGWFDTLRNEGFEKKIRVTSICPGPVFSGILRNAMTSKPGEEYGVEMKEKEKRMSTKRCAYLSAVAIANQLDEVWISLHPILLFVYLAQYMPTIARRVAKRLGMRQLKKMREGQ